MARVVVVGAGVGGCCAALRLAAAGHGVTVVEAAEEVGGKLGRCSVDGFTFDTGPSLLTMPQVFADLFSDVGERIDDHLDLQPVEPIASYRWTDGTTVATTADPAAMADRFAVAMGPDAAADWAAMSTRAAQMWRAVEEPVLRSPVAGVASLARLTPRLGDLRRIAPHATLRDLGRRYLRDPRQRMMLDRYATYTGSDPRRAPAALATIAYAELAFGGWYVAGGLHRLATVIAELAMRRGATFRTGTRVTGLRLSQGRVAGVTVEDGEDVPADVVVSNVDARVLFSSLLPERRGPRRLRYAPASSSGFVLLLGVEAESSQPVMGHHTVLFPTDYDAEFDALFGPQPAPVADPTIYIARPQDPAMAPVGAESWFVLVNAPRQDQVDWTAPGMAEAYRDHLLAVMAHRGLDVRSRLHVVRMRTPADLEAATGAPGGAIYGSSSNGPVAAFLRAPNRAPVPGLFLVGGSAHPGGGLPLVALSAELAAGLIGAADAVSAGQPALRRAGARSPRPTPRPRPTARRSR